VITFRFVTSFLSRARIYCWCCNICRTFIALSLWSPFFRAINCQIYYLLWETHQPPVTKCLLDQK